MRNMSSGKIIKSEHDDAAEATAASVASLISWRNDVKIAHDRTQTVRCKPGMHIFRLTSRLLRPIMKPGADSLQAEAYTSHGQQF